MIASGSGRARVRRGVSFLEIAIGVLILGLAVGPMLAIFSNLTGSTAVSIHEVMASQYAAEILEQVRLLPTAAIKEANGGTSLADLRPMISLPPGPAGTTALSKHEVFPGVHLLASPLPGNVFSGRVLFLERVVRNAGTTPVNLILATVVISWDVPGSPGPRQFSASTWLMEP